jgi:hypothetical protein
MWRRTVQNLFLQEVYTESCALLRLQDPVLGHNCEGAKLTANIYLGPSSRKADLYLHFSIRFRGMMPIEHSDNLILTLVEECGKIRFYLQIGEKYENHVNLENLVIQLPLWTVIMQMINQKLI